MSRECEITRILEARVARGDATDGEREQVEAHLKICPACGNGRARITPKRARPKSKPKPERRRSPESKPEPKQGDRPFPTRPVVVLAAVAVVAFVVWFVGTNNDGDAVDEPETATGMLVLDEAAPDAPESEPVVAAEPEPELEPELAEPVAAPEPEPEPEPVAEPVPAPVVSELEPTPVAAPEPTPEEAAASPDPMVRCGAFEIAAARASGAEETARSLLRCGECWQEAKDPGSALRLYDQIIANHISTSSGPAALFNKGVVCEQLERPGTATAAYADYRREFPDAPRVGDALFRLCRIHGGAGRHEQAINCLQRYRRNYGDEKYVTDSYYYEAVALEKTNDPRLADAVTSFLEREPSGARATEVRAWIAP